MPDRALRRLGAYLLDWADEPLIAVWTTTWLATSVPFGQPLAVTWVAWIAHQLAHQARTGQTFGKRCMRLAVVDRTTGDPIGLLRTLVRWLAHAVDTCVPIAWCRILLGHDVRTVADRLVRSDVVDVCAAGAVLRRPWEDRARAVRTSR